MIPEYPQYPLTVAQASRVLGISERTLRRILRQPEIQAQILAQDRHTATGLRRSSLLPPELIRELQRSKNLQFEDQQEIQANTGRMPDAMVFAYERLLAEQTARINDLQQTLVIERERLGQVTALLIEAQEALSRYQNSLEVVGSQNPIQNLWQRLCSRK